MSKYGPKEQSALERAKAYGMFPETVREDDSLTFGNLCEVFLYLCDHFRRLYHRTCDNGLLEGHPMQAAFYQCCAHQLIPDPQQFASEIDEPVTCPVLREMAEAYCAKNGIAYHAQEMAEVLEEAYGICILWNDPCPAGMVAVVVVDLAVRYAETVAVKFRALTAQRQYEAGVALLLKHRCMDMLLPDFREHFEMLDLLTAYPEVNEISVDYLKYNTEIQQIFETYFGYARDGNGVFSDPIYHYTSLGTLEKVSGGSPLRLSNAVNLNDPAEGRALFEFLNSGAFDSEALEVFGEVEANPSNFYIISFNANPDDDIPMWQQYAAGSMGCRLAYRLEQFRHCPIYRVVYEQETLSRFLADLIAYHRESVSAAGEDSRILLDAVIRDILTQASFCYKDQAYQYEHEVRVIRRVAPEKALEGDIRDGEYFPRLYTELPAGMKLDAVLLGPKVSDYLMDHIRVGLRARGIRCDVARSRIKIR